MAVNFTPDQQRAIDLHHCNILVSAAAGSGKTAVLSERIAKMVCDKDHPVDIDRLLVVTFTHAAAAEMRERISRRIADRLKEDGENEHLQKQAALLHNAQITTIDSFCQFILKNNFQDIGLDPVFRVADEGEVKFIKQEILEELLEERFAEGRESFLNCVEFFCPNGREEQLEQHILKLHQYSLSFPFPKDWLEERKTDYAFQNARELDQTSWMVFLSNHIQKSILALSEELTRARKLCEESDGPYMYGPMIEKDEEAVLALTKIGDVNLLREKLQTITFDMLSRKKDDTVSDEKREQVKEIRNQAKKFIEKLNKELFSVSVSTTLAEAKVCNEVIGELVDICLEFSDRLDAKKREKKIVDFSDMEHLALQILVEKDEKGNVVPTKTALEYQDYFEEVLIDEYQDSNLVQEYLLSAVSRSRMGEKNRFMVGDVKQSIYKFRLARPALFLEKYKSYSPEAGEECRIDLHQNFRSRKEVIDSVNTVFEKIMTESIGGIVYDDAAALHAGASYPENSGCESEFLLVEKPAKEMDEDAKETEARAIAQKIIALMETFRVTEQKREEETGEEIAFLRPLMYKDIVILVRSQNGYDEAFKKVFDECGIPLYATGKEGYFSTKEIRDVLEFLRILDNPCQDIPLFAVMKSVFGGFSDEELGMIRANTNRTKTLYENVREAAGTGNEKCALFLKKISRYREYAVYMTIREILENLFAEHDYLAYVSAQKTGAKRLANVEMLLTKAEAFEKNSYYGLFHFIRYIEQMEKFEVDSGEAVTLDENADVVRLMTIHKSKGLEFPVAIIAGMGKKFNNMDHSGSFIMDTDLGIGVDYVNVAERFKRKTLRKNVMAMKMRLDNLAEEMRVLYVAMTRAREKLILTASVSDPVGMIEKRDRTVNYRNLAEASGYLSLLLPVFPDIKAVTLADLSWQETENQVDRIMRREQLLFSESLADEEKLGRIKERLSFAYPFAYLQDVYTKTSVSELKMKAIHGGEEEMAKETFPEEEVVPYVPNFMRRAEEVSGTTRGSAMHRIMELLDFTKEYQSPSDVKEAMEGFVSEGRLSEEYHDAIRVDKVFRFLKSDLGQRMKKAQAEGKLFREQPFVLGIDEVETVLIQGIMDAYFEEDGEMVLLDYKTDVIASPAELVSRYKVQIDYYEKALLSLTGKRVKEKILYSFYFEKEVPVNA